MQFDANGDVNSSSSSSSSSGNSSNKGGGISFKERLKSLPVVSMSEYDAFVIRLSIRHTNCSIF